MITCPPPPHQTPRFKLETVLDNNPPPMSLPERWALQELADRHGFRWRTVLFADQQKGTLTGVLKEFMSRPTAGNEIARAQIIPRSLPPVALYYGTLGF